MELENNFPLHTEIWTHNTLYSFSEILFAMNVTVILHDGFIPLGLGMHLFLCRLGIWLVSVVLLTEKEVVINTSDIPSVLFLVSYSIVAISYIVTVYLKYLRRHKNITFNAGLFHVQDFERWMPLC